jgi:TPR repeat protein
VKVIQNIIKFISPHLFKIFLSLLFIPLFAIISQISPNLAAASDENYELTIRDTLYRGEGVFQNKDEAKTFLKLVQLEITEEDIKMVKKMSEEGDATAQYNMGVLYDNGMAGFPLDKIQAVKWYKLAAEQGYKDAQHNLGVLYDEGQGVAKDSKEAVKWYRQAADQGSKESQYNLGLKYYNGDGVPKSTSEAIKWFQLAADQDLPEAKDAIEKLTKPKKK